MKRLLLLSICLSLGGFSPTWADLLEVSGDVWGVWSADTVVVTGEVRVPPGQTLAIEPGVEIYFFIYCKFIVDDSAALIATGTMRDSISFMEHWLWPTNGWHGIRFINASNVSILEYCHLTNGYAYGGGDDENGGAVHCYNSSPVVQNCLIDRCSATGSGGGIACYSNSCPIISDNVIGGNSADGYGAGIYCDNSSPVINGNDVSSNTAGGNGGGISCHNNSCPVIDSNYISGNANAWGSGGGICCYESSPVINGNTISGNSATYGFGGGGIYCYNASPDISVNVINANLTYWDGGGICCHGNSSPSITNNTLSGNSASNGAGVYIEDATISTFEFNEISNNSGEGVQIYNSNVTMNKNTIVDNQDPYSGGISCTTSSMEIRNCILWGNTSQQIHLGSGGSVQATYCDIQDGWTGIGNIDDNPIFINSALSDYRLQWGSPCIDSGDPDPQYYDPDGTRADMGCYYYDQSMPVRILLTPYGVPIQISAVGGSFDFNIQATNADSVSHPTTIWCDITMPSGQVYGPVLGPVTINMPAGLTVERDRSQDIPAFAPPGLFSFNAYAEVAGIYSTDSFPFVKLSTGDGESEGSWNNNGEPFDEWFDLAQDAIDIPENYSLYPNYPNPFNPITVLGFQLPVACWVKLEVFDISGSRVGVDLASTRQYPPGTHEVTFNGSNLSSGIYIYNLTAGDYKASGKMVLMK
ncbi:hypothetical protein CEE37_06015 [candidate division LCP-89 bacterium B3_LCP]|uniref:Secretion system C-terminal sorting domain-containing protein n=1 Tax=candidate division LCP-89 bacterium B3_LCP TaxID=2012998 RepID=A0A532V229_UNCL8|nr:MAG: hypothetical protein CEE37_06015 [candidate division LCP-89 bacterium B3_LCP]